MAEALTWTVTVFLTEESDTTRTDALLGGAADELHGCGRARRSSAHPELAAVGEEEAAARAVFDLAHHLLEQAAHTIESWELYAVRLGH